MKVKAMMRESAVKKQDEQEQQDEQERDQTAVAEDDEPEPEPEPEPEAKVGKKDKAPPREPVSKVMRDQRELEDKNLRDWLEDISPGGSIRVKVTRQSPKVWKGLNVGGALATYDQMIDEEWIRDHHGGGDYYLVVQRPKTTGPGWVYGGARVVRIAGDPRTDDVFRDKPEDRPAAQQQGGQIVERAFQTLERQLEKQQQPSRHSGPDTETLRMMMAPLQRQIDQMSTMLTEKDRQIQAQQHRAPPTDEFRDKMIDKLLDGDSARINGLRAQYESELRQVKQSAIDNESRLRDSFERDKVALAMSHERETNAIRGAYDLKVAAQEQSHNTSRTLLDAEVRRLERDLNECKAELTALRLKKDKSILEQATEFAAIKEAIGEITGGGDEDKSTLDRVFEAASPTLQAVAARVLGGGEAAAPAPVMNPAPVRMQRRMPRVITSPEGVPFVQTADGRLRPVKRAPAATPEGPPPAVILPATLKISVDFLESAFRNNQEPDVVATTVRSMIPAEVLGVIRDRGVDAFLTEVAKIESTSPLASQAGRNWARKVGKALLG